MERDDLLREDEQQIAEREKKAAKGPWIKRTRNDTAHARTDIPLLLERNFTLLVRPQSNRSQDSGNWSLHDPARAGSSGEG